MIFAIKPFEIHDGDGIRTTIFFKGCPLRCKWCHNPESLSPQREISYDPSLCKSCMMCTSLCEANVIDNAQHVFRRELCTVCGKCDGVCLEKALTVFGREASAEEIASEALRDEIFMKGSGGGVTFSGGEPLLQPDLCIEIARILKSRGINIAVDTSAYVPQSAIDRIIPFVDTFLFDIKAMDEDVHIACTGVSNKLILENILHVDSLGIPFEIRYPFVPTMNDQEAEAIGRFASGLKHMKLLKLLPYHNYAQQKYECLGRGYPIPSVPLPAKEELEKALSILKACGVKNVSIDR